MGKLYCTLKTTKVYPSSDSFPVYSRKIKLIMLASSVFGNTVITIGPPLLFLMEILLYGTKFHMEFNFIILWLTAEL